MANVKAVDGYKYCVLTPLELAGKVRTYIKGKKLPARKITGRGIRTPFRAMTPSDFFVAAAEEKLADFKMDAESAQWIEVVLAKNLKAREKQIAKNFAARKPDSEKLKSGPKPGNPSPKFIAAMRKLGAERRATNGTWYGAKKKESSGKKK